MQLCEDAGLKLPTDLTEADRHIPLLVFRRPPEALAYVKGKQGENCNAPEDRRPGSDCAGKKPGHEDGEKWACVGAKDECGSANESEYGTQLSATG
jgi:hypothetical protein